MAKKKKKTDMYENFYFTVDDWCHEYTYGINHSKTITEFNIIRIIGRIRNQTKRKIETGELYLSCMDGAEDELIYEAGAEGPAWVRNRRLVCSVSIPATPFLSLPAPLAAGKFDEFYVTVRNLRYSNGDTDSFSIRQGLSNLEDDGEKPAELADELACFEAIDS